MDLNKKESYDKLIDEFAYVDRALVERQLDGEIFNSFNTSTVAAVLVATNNVCNSNN